MATKYTRYTKKSSASWQAGTQASPSSLAAYRVEDLDYNIEQAEVVATNTFIGEYQGAPPRPAGRYVTASFTTELRGSLTGLMPFEGALLRACGFDETEYVDGSTVYGHYQLGDLHLDTMTPAGDVDPVDITVNLDREKVKADNCVGNARIRLEANQIPKMDFTFRGQVDETVATSTTASYAEDTVPSITVGANPVPVQNTDFRIKDLYGISTAYVVAGIDINASPTKDAIVISGDYTSTFTEGTTFTVTQTPSISNGIDGSWTVSTSTYDSVAGETTITVDEAIAGGSSATGAQIRYVYRCYSTLVVNNWNIDVGSALDERSDMNAAFGFNQPLITSNNPTSDCQIEVPTLGEFNPYNLFIQNTPLRISCVINNGGGVNDAITIYQDVRMTAMPTKTDVNGKAVFNLAFMGDVGTFTDVQAQNVTTEKLTLFWHEGATPPGTLA